jgi:hypothetical protein
MGKLKTALQAITAGADAIEKDMAKSLGELEKLQNNLVKQLERLNGGYELLYMYLKQKAVKEKAQIAAWHKDPLSGHSDGKVAEFIKDIEGVRTECLGSFGTWERTADGLVQALVNDSNKALASVADAQAQVAKKEKKWFQSAKYKAKIGGYKQSLNELEKKLRTLQVDISTIKESTQSAGPRKLASLQVTPSKTIDAVFQIAQKGLTDELDKIKKFDGKKLGTLLKRYGTEIKMIRSWISDADGMDTEAGA